MAQTAAAITNPLLARLRRGGGALARWPGLTGAAVAGAGLWVCYWYAVLSQSNATTTVAGMAGFAAFGLGISSVLTLVLFLPMLTANLTMTYVRSPEYAQVCATPLPDRALVRAFVGAVQYRTRALRLLAMLMLPLATMVLLPWFNVLPGGGTGSWANGGDPVRGVYLLVVMELAFYGLLRWVVSLGVVVALWTRWVVVSGLVALLLPTPLWWATAQAFSNLTPAGATVGVLAGLAMLAAVPYGLAWLTERWGWRWARARVTMPG